MKKREEIFVSVIIAAAGRGTRMNSGINKQYIDICGVPVLARTIGIFQECKTVNEIIVVVNRDDIIYCKKNIVDEYKFTKVSQIIAGGDSRQKSVLNGLNAVNSNTEIVLIHDGARPFVKQEIIIESIDAAKKFGAACVAVPVKDTVKRAVVKDGQNFVVETIPRETLWLIQTPQAFRYSLIKQAHKKASEEGFEGTDDSILVERLGLPVKIVMGSYDNIKITTWEDLVIGEAILTKSELSLKG
ncbi:MAG TPA: 2-C-methyl-D-erythritol 4-phosphate cytidylyltransferase [Clostridiaceae bacterium]|nr:2-C-methyl-D-erythritol 4-phosphate cytidylyltransferase [Clostridiaceae bacterium]